MTEEDHGLSVWALEPYFGGSHRQFLEGLRAHSAHRLELHTLPGRHWKWRMQGGALSLARSSYESAGEEGPDVLFASDMLDLPYYTTLAHPAARRAPTIMYFHENQLTYPLPPGVERDLGYGLKNVASALAADRVLFNSDFHRRDFLRGVRELLDSVPDEVPARVLEEVEEKSRVLPLGCDLRRLDEPEPGRWRAGGPGPLLLWNQRWEYDKAPEDFFQALYTLAAEGLDFRVAVAGPNRGEPTAEFREVRERLGDRIVQWGRVESQAEYADLLRSADIVVSTALHEFFGVAVVEAIYCGCRPILPARLSYPELVPMEVQDRVLYGEEGPVPLLRQAIAEGLPWSPEWQRTWVISCDWANMGRRYDEEIWSCWESSREE